MSSSLAFEQVWTDRSSYENAERIYHEKQGGVTCSKITLTPLADEVARARQRLINIKNSFDSSAEACTTDASAVCLIEKKFVEFTKVIQTIQDQLTKIDSRLKVIENKFEGNKQAQSCAIDMCKIPAKTTTTDEKADDDDVDLFASDEEDDAEAEKIKQARLAEYNAKKSKKPALIAKSSIVLDCKPWDDETDMKKMEEHVRSITMEGLLWGASKLVELAYGIKKLQISCVVEDDKVSVDELQEKIEGFEDYVQSVDIAAFNKI